MFIFFIIILGDPTPTHALFWWPFWEKQPSLGPIFREDRVNPFWEKQPSLGPIFREDPTPNQFRPPVDHWASQAKGPKSSAKSWWLPTWRHEIGCVYPRLACPFGTWKVKVITFWDLKKTSNRKTKRSKGRFALGK